MKIVLVSLTCFILGGATFYAFGQYQKMKDENTNLKMKLTTTPPVTTDSTEVTSITDTPQEKKMDSKPTVEEGSIEGTLGYPSSGIPELAVYAYDSMDEKKYYMVNTKVNQTEFTISGVTPGSYYVVAYAKDYAISGAYTKMVPCGLSVDCKDHSMIAITVKANETTKGVEVKDWYAPEGTFPKKP